MSTHSIVNMSSDCPRGSDEAKTKPSQKLTSFSISSILGESPGVGQTGECPGKTSAREATGSPRETVGVAASGFDQEAKVAAMTAWYPWIFQHDQQYTHFPFVEGTCLRACVGACMRACVRVGLCYSTKYSKIQRIPIPMTLYV